MDTKQLEYILAIAHSGSIGRAAKKVGLTQQALSKSLARLEAHYGGKLFERTSRGMSLTRLGAVVCEHARDVVATYGRLETAIASELDIERGRIIIGLSPIAATSRAGRVLTNFATQNPALRIDIENGINRDFGKALDLGQIDLAIASDLDGSTENYMRETIGHEKWGIVGRKDHPVLSQAKSLHQLHDVNWIIGRNTDTLNDAIDTSFLNAKISPPRPGIMTTSVLYALSALANSDHLAILPQSLCISNTGLLWKDLSEGQWITPVFLMRRRQAHMSVVARNLVNLLTRNLDSEL